MGGGGPMAAMLKMTASSGTLDTLKTVDQWAWRWAMEPSSGRAACTTVWIGVRLVARVGPSDVV